MLVNQKKRCRSNSFNEDHSNKKLDTIVKHIAKRQRTYSLSFDSHITLVDKSKSAPSLSPILTTEAEHKSFCKTMKRRLSFSAHSKKLKGGQTSAASSTGSQPLKKKFLFGQFRNQQIDKHPQSLSTSQIEGPSMENTYGFCVNAENSEVVNSNHENQHLTVMSVEVHVDTQGGLLPNPQQNPISAVIFCISNDIPEGNKVTKEITGVLIIDCSSTDETAVIPSDEYKECRNHIKSVCQEKNIEKNPTCSEVCLNKTSIDSCETKLNSLLENLNIATSSKPSLNQTLNKDKRDSYHELKRNLLMRSGITNLSVISVKNEKQLIEELIQVVKCWDPDILVGYEVQMLSWGYILQRAMHLGINLYSLLSRIPEDGNSKKSVSGKSNFSFEMDEYGTDHMSEIHITGRIVLNVWRIMRKEININIYTFENVCYHVLHHRVPRYSFQTLAAWFSHETDLFRWRVIEYYVTRTRGTLQLLDSLNIIGKTSELARVFGIQFYEVLSRGSQFRVESMMMRSAKPLNYILISPSVHQRASSRAAECIPLILEPESKFYTSPVLVLDFQSLYPSMMIAYNYCFSTCLGRIEHLGKDVPFAFGCNMLQVPPHLLKELKNDIHISPNGIAFVKPNIRRGVLPQMLEEILNTRIMIKKVMKDYKHTKALYRLLDARQLGLKLIANVTYGYTSANFSGRMPCVEVADSIVGKARETLERAIRLVEETPRWQAKVVYGDTDSMFVLLQGRSKEAAFKIGMEIAEAVTATNPKPVKLKFEKVYLPCVLQTKKRYCGFMFESVEQKEPVFDAKGIETVRRDSCPAVAKILEKSLKLLFTTRDVSKVKQFVQKQFQKLLSGRASIQDCIFAREFRGISGYRPGACVPALEIARRRLRLDPRSEPRVGERVPYVIVYGYPGLPLIQLVHEPHELLEDSNLKINGKYYISRVIVPPLERVFSLIGANVMSWYLDLPHIARLGLPTAPISNQHKGTLSQYFTSLACPVCGGPALQGICKNCQSNPQMITVALNEKIMHWERACHHFSQICQNCTGTRDSVSCISLDCPVLFRLCQAKKDLLQAPYLRSLKAHVLEF